MKKLSLLELNRVDVEAYKRQPKFPIIVALDDIRSALNVGSFFRTADAFNIEAMVLGGITATPPHKEITKSAIGATDSVEWSHQSDLVSFIKKAKIEGYTIIGIEQTTASVRLHEVRWSDYNKVVLIFGNEVEGIQDELMPLIDVAVEVPQFGTKHSLNVSVCGGVVLWDVIQHLFIRSDI